MEETAAAVGANTEWFVSVIGSLIAASTTVILAVLNKKRLEDKILNQNLIIQKQSKEIEEIKKISQDLIKQYKGPFHFIHRVKLKVLLDESRKNTEPFLFVDSDTRWLSYPEELLQIMSSKEAAISPTCYLHVRESDNLANISDQYNKMYENFGPALQSFGVHLDQPFQMWNTGAVGVNQGAIDFFEKSLKLADFLIPRVLPTYWLEQTSLSMIAINHYQVNYDNLLIFFWQFVNTITTSNFVVYNTKILVLI